MGAYQLAEKSLLELSLNNYIIQTFSKINWPTEYKWCLHDDSFQTGLGSKQEQHPNSGESFFVAFQPKRESTSRGNS